MAFGGYKFAGFKVDNTQYNNVTNRCLAIHAARVRAFLTASGLAGNPWTADSDRLTGEIDLNASTGVLTSGVNNGVIHSVLGATGNVDGYISYFKYSSGDLTGYYLIFTARKYAFYNYESSEDFIYLNTYMANWEYTSGWYSEPDGASCLHALSLTPFGNTVFNLITQFQPSMRLKTVGHSGYSSMAMGNDSGFVGYSGGFTQFGYVIKDADIITFSGSGSNNNFADAPQGCVKVLSLKGFSELYNKDDTYPLLELDIKSGHSGGGANERLSNGYKSYFDTVLSPTGDPLIGIRRENQNCYVAEIMYDARTLYNLSGAQTTPFSGLTIGIRDKKNETLPFSDSTQVIKGCTNPEFIACNVSTTAPQNSMYSIMFDGNLLYLYSTSSAVSTPSMWNGREFDNQPVMDGYVNFFIGWDSSNPDIKTDAAWPEYNATV